jgi:hypothetical protein
MVLLKWLKDRFAQARGLSAADWLLLFEAWWDLLFFWLILRWSSYERFARAPQGENPDLPRVERMHRLVLWASRLHLLPMTCLMQACTLRQMAARRGLQAQVRIGATRTAQGIHAHAWVEVDGQPVGEEGVKERFSMLKSIGG